MNTASLESPSVQRGKSSVSDQTERTGEAHFSRESRVPSEAERMKLFAAVCNLRSSSAVGHRMDIVEFLWSRHFFRQPSDKQSFVSQSTQRMNRYSFDLESLPNDSFWQVYAYLELD